MVCFAVLFDSRQIFQMTLDLSAHLFSYLFWSTPIILCIMISRGSAIDRDNKGKYQSLRVFAFYVTVLYVLNWMSSLPPTTTTHLF